MENVAVKDYLNEIVVENACGLMMYLIRYTEI